MPDIKRWVIWRWSFVSAGLVIGLVASMACCRVIDLVAGLTAGLGAVLVAGLVLALLNFFFNLGLMRAIGRWLAGADKA